MLAGAEYILQCCLGELLPAYHNPCHLINKNHISFLRLRNFTGSHRCFLFFTLNSYRYKPALFINVLSIQC